MSQSTAGGQDCICVVCIMFKEEEYPDFPFTIRFGASVSFAECNVQEAIHSYDCSEDIVL